MKTHTNRIHRDAGTKPADVQPKNLFPARDAIDRMKQAKSQSVALHWLLSDILTMDRPGLYNEETEYGIALLICNAHEKMESAFESVQALLEGQ
jgi:hypothetical protein